MFISVIVTDRNDAFMALVVVWILPFAEHSRRNYYKSTLRGNGGFSHHADDPSRRRPPDSTVETECSYIHLNNHHQTLLLHLHPTYVRRKYVPKLMLHRT